MTTDATQVTREDRETAARVWSYIKILSPEQGEEILLGKWDDTDIVQAFARHREATTATLTAQVEALTAERDALREALEYISKHSFGAAYGGDHVSCYECLHTHESARAALASTSEGEG